MDPETKMALGKVLAGGPVRVADASPGPALFAELDSAAAWATWLSTAPDAYLASLDVFVAKYPGGLPPAGRGRPKRRAVVPNGVPDPVPLERCRGPSPPADWDPALAVVTVGRLVREKKIHLLPALARRLAELVPGATLTVVGGAHGPREDRDFAAMCRAGRGGLPDNLFLAGPDHRTLGFLPRFAVFLMISINQGCPNASLEAMSAGLPVVANDDGGTREQVIDGVTGRLVPTLPDRELVESLARALADVLSDPARSGRMGRAGRDRVRALFSMKRMADGYLSVLHKPEDCRWSVPS
jgi:glycosyltransferase involved in cell wall biosynthesis